VLGAPTQPRNLTGIARLAAASPLIDGKRSVEYHELPSRSILNRCASPRVPFRWTINPYRGCEFGCHYCYARYAHEFMELDPREFDTRIFVKSFPTAMFRSEIAAVPREDHIAIGTATDPYQPAERRFRLTRRILEVLAEEKGLHLSITTKSDLILRDIDLLQAISRASVLHVAFTVTTMDAALTRKLEPRAPRPELRLGALEALKASGVSTGVFMSPILPGLNDSEEQIDAVGGAAFRAGARYFGGNVLFLRASAAAVFFPFLERERPDLVRKYRTAFGLGSRLPQAYVERIKARVDAVRLRHGLAPSPSDYQPQLWHGEPQLSLFPVDAIEYAAPHPASLPCR